MITQKLDLNLIPGRVLPMVNVSQYDKDSRTLEFTIYNGDASFDLTGLSTYIQGLKPDGHGFNYSATISSGKITADVTEQMTAVAGRVMCEVIIMSGTDRIGTGNFVLNVEAAAMPDGSNMSDSEYSYIEELIEDAQEAATDAEAWAVGERGGVPVDPSDPTYENSAHYWAQQASEALNDMTGATASTDGVHGLVPAPAAGDQAKYLKGDGTWAKPAASELSFDNNGTGMTATNPQDAITELNTDIKENAMTAVEQDDSLALAPTSAGNALPLTIYGQSTQNGTPTPSAPVAIESASADFKCVGKNLLPISSFNTDTKYGITFTNNNDGTWGISGTNNGTDASLKNVFAFDDKAEGMKVNCSSQYAYRIRYQVSKNDSTFIGEQLFYDNTVIVAFPSGSTYALIQLNVNKNVAVTGTETVYTIMTLPDVTDTTYEPYKHTDITTNLTLRAIEVTSSDPYNLVKYGHYYIADTIDWDEVDGYQITRRVGVITATGSETPTASLSNDTANSKCYIVTYTNKFTKNASSNERVSIVSDCFNGDKTNAGLRKFGGMLAQHNNGTRDLSLFLSLDTTVTTTALAQSWLLANTPTFYYPLDTPTTEAVSSAQAKALLSMRTYDESTSIDAVNAPAPVMELEYAKTRTPALALTGHNMAHINAIDIGDM